MKKKDEMLMSKTEMRMLRWIQGINLREHKINEEIRAAATVQPIATHLMQKRLRWYQWRSQGATGAMPPPKLLVNVFFLQRIDVVTFFES